MVQRYNILGRYTNQCLCLCSHAWPVEVSHGKIRVRLNDNTAFSGCKQLKQISVDKENAIFDSRNNCNAIIETASNKLLYGCKNTIIPPNVSIIGEAAFLENEEITSIVIPEGIESIEPYAFYGCKNLKSIYSYVKDPTACFIHVSAFFEHGDNVVLYVPKGTADVYRNAQDGWQIFNDLQEFNT